MRRIKKIAVPIAIVLFMAGCKKSSSGGSVSSLAGTWELRQSYGNVGTINYPSGNNFVLKFTASTYFTSDTTQAIIVRGAHRQTGTYTIVDDNSAAASTGINITQGQFKSRLILDGDTSSEKIFIQITNNQLIFLSGYFPVDGGVQLTYQKN